MLSAIERAPLISLTYAILLSLLELVFLNIVKMNRDLRTPVDGSFCPVWLPCSGCFRRPATE